MDKKIESAYLTVITKKIGSVLTKVNIDALSKHNRGYMLYKDDPLRYFVLNEMSRFKKTIDYISRNFREKKRILDIGTFIPFIPLALKELGHEVHCAEKIELYEGALDPVFELCTKEGIYISDLDVLLNSAYSELSAQFDIVLLTAVLEHLNGSPRPLLLKIFSLLHEDGHLNVEVPNIANLRKRINFLLRGRPPLPLYKDYYDSEYPFSGHCREYTIDELKYCLSESGFKILHMDNFMYDNPESLKPLSRLFYTIEKLGPGSWKQGIWAWAIKARS